MPQFNFRHDGSVPILGHERLNPIYPPDNMAHQRPDCGAIVDGEYAHATQEEQDRRNEQAGLRPVMKFTHAAYNNVMRDLAGGTFQCEQGGILLGPCDTEDLVIRYVKDSQGDSRPASFTIDAEYLNGQLRKVKDAGLTGVGIIHSHPPGCTRPSYGDLEFLHQIFRNPNNRGGLFLFPIVSGRQLYPFVVDTTDVRRVQLAELVLV